MIRKLEQRFATLLMHEIFSDFSCLDPCRFLKPLLTTALSKISEVLSFEITTILMEELIDKTKKKKFKSGISLN